MKSGVLEEWLPNFNLWTWNRQEFLEIWYLYYHHDGWTEVEVAEFIPSFKFILLGYVNSHDIEGSNHDHSDKTLAP